VDDEKLDRDDDEIGGYPHGGAFFAAHSVVALTLGVTAVLLVAGHRHSSAAAGCFWVVGGAFLVAGGFSPTLRFGPVSRLRWQAAHSRVRRGAPRFSDRFVVAFDPYGRAFNVLLGSGFIVYGLLRLTGQG
jgi:hypothetical protein